MKRQAHETMSSNEQTLAGRPERFRIGPRTVGAIMATPSTRPTAVRSSVRGDNAAG